MNQQQQLALLERHLPKSDAEMLAPGTLRTEHRALTVAELLALLSNDKTSGWLTTAKGNWYRLQKTAWAAAGQGAEPDLLAAVTAGKLLSGELILDESKSLRIERDGSALLGWFIEAAAGGDEVIWQAVTRKSTIPSAAGSPPDFTYHVAWRPTHRAHAGISADPLQPVAARLVALKEA